MRILAITATLPYPPNSGSKLRSYHLLRALSREHDIFLCALSDRQPSEEELRHLREFCREVHVEVRSRSNVVKTCDVLRSFFTLQPYIVLANSSAELTRTLRKRIADWNIELVQLEELCTAGNLPREGLPVPFVLNAHNQEGALLNQIAVGTPLGFRGFFRRAQARMLSRFEREVASRSKAVLAVSAAEAEYFKTVNSSVMLIPNGVPEVIGDIAPRCSKELLFVGTLSYPPNEEGVRELVHEVLPRVKARYPDASLTVVGRGASRALEEELEGRALLLRDVPDIAPFLSRAAVMMVVLRAGGGSRLKILEAFAAGLPVVSTAVGASGLAAEDRRHLLLGDSAESLAERAIELFESETLRTALASEAHALVRRSYQWCDIASRLSETYTSWSGSGEAPGCAHSRRKRLLITVPHRTLLGPQGHRERFDGLLSLLGAYEVQLLVPRGIDPEHLRAFAKNRLHEFDEPRAFGIDLPFTLDFSRSFKRALGEVVQREAIDLVIFDFPWGLWSFRRRSAIPAVYFAHGVEQEFAEVMLKDRRLSFFPVRQLFCTAIGRIERAASSKAGLIIAMSGRDAELLAGYHGIEREKILVLPQPAPAAAAVSSPPRGGPSVRRELGLPSDAPLVAFHGSYRHLPNRTAMKMLKERVCPVLAAALPEALVAAAGPDVPRSREGNFLQIGFVENLATFLSCCSVAAVPIFEGSGVRMKLLDYFAAGVPVVSTKKGAEGLDIVNGREAIITEDCPDQLASALLELLKDEERRQALAQAAHRYLLSRHDRDMLAELLEGRLAAVLSAAV